jgi:hypothetical protein
MSDAEKESRVDGSTESQPLPEEAKESPTPAKRKFNLQVKDLELKQPPMEAVLDRET